MNGSFINLTEEEQENLLRAIETSLQVKKRHQFFLWTQGPLQAFIPHKTLISLVTRDGEEMLVMDRFNSCVVSEQTFEDVCHPVDGVVMRAMRCWRETGDSPFLIAPGVQMPLVLYNRFRDQLEQVEFGCAAGHGSTPVDGCGISSSFFFFAHMPDTITVRHAYFLELLMPHIHMAFLRTLGQADRVLIGADGSMHNLDLRNAMSDREIEILGWVKEGKSNQEIGMALNISPLTVKNHVQRILRKLKVRNRAQAVSKATAMRLIVGYTGAN
jgi:transcriptional regulator EpsA